ncbi:hypothetical protein [Phocaeicola sartorii]|uniref:hypothetical protein n=1 Tax=Phocaeicola sartorii TaxID=671267 RepID=UPI0026360BF2|nr:hypothetical protein [Phocaeicola sartorii]
MNSSVFCQLIFRPTAQGTPLWQSRLGVCNPRQSLRRGQFLSSRAASRLRHLVLCSLHRLNGYWLIAGLDKQARHKPTVGFVGINNEYLVHRKINLTLIFIN